MTTTIIVKANHGWPVDVTSKNAKTGESMGPAQRVEKNAERSFAVFGGTDLLVHEVQPDEIEADMTPDSTT